MYYYKHVQSCRFLTDKQCSGSASASGSVSQRYGSEDPDPHPDPYNMSRIRNTADKNRSVSPTAPERDLPEAEPLRDRERPLPLPEREPDLDLCAKNKNDQRTNGDKKQNRFVCIN